MSEGLGTSKGRVEIKPEDWITLKDHLRIFLDRGKDRIEIAWASDCGEKSCTVPHCTVIFYSCPSKPCGS